MSETIYFKGRKYNSVAEMPQNERQLYLKMIRFMRDDNLDGIPDIVQSHGLSELKETINMIKEIAKIESVEGLENGQMSVVRVTDSGSLSMEKNIKAQRRWLYDRCMVPNIILIRT